MRIAAEIEAEALQARKATRAAATAKASAD
jgi:hypothetical protein